MFIKKHSSFIIVGLMILSIFLIKEISNSTVVYAADKSIINERFDDYPLDTVPASPTPWTQVKIPASSEIKVVSDSIRSNVLQLSITGGNSTNPYVSKDSINMTSVSGITVVDLWIKPSNNILFDGSISLTCGNDVPIVYPDLVRFKTGKINFLYSTDLVEVQSFQGEQWYHITVVLNSNTKMADLYIDGIKKVTQQPITYWTNFAKINVKFQCKNAPGNTFNMCLDDINIFQPDLAGVPPYVSGYSSSIFSGSTIDKPTSNLPLNTAMTLDFTGLENHFLDIDTINATGEVLNNTTGTIDSSVVININSDAGGSKLVDGKSIILSFTNLQYNTSYTLNNARLKVNDIFGRTMAVLIPSIVFSTTAPPPPFLIDIPVFKAVYDDHKDVVNNILPGVIEGSVQVTNNLDQGSNICVIMWLYQNGVLKNASYQDQVIVKNATQNVAATLSVPDDGKSYTIQLMVWDSIQDMLPLLEITGNLN